MSDISQELILKSITELFIIVDKDGNYLDYFGGSNSEKYQGLEELKGKSVHDFLSEGVANNIKLAIRYSLESRSPAYARYSIDAIGDLKEQHYRAEISPIIGSKDTAIMSITNVSLEVESIERMYLLTPFDPEISVQVMNKSAFKENRLEFLNTYPVSSEILMVIDQFDIMEMFCEPSKLLDAENHIATHIIKYLGDSEYVLGRPGKGAFQVISNLKQNVLKNLLEQVSKRFGGKSISARGGKMQFNIKLNLLTP